MTFPFASQTVGELVESIRQGYSDTDMGTLFLQAAVDRWAPDDYPNKGTRLQRLFQNLRRSEDPEAAKATLDLAERVVAHGAPCSPHGQPTVWWDDLCAALAADGWEWNEENKRLVPTVPGVEVGAEMALVESELEERGWRTARGHYRQAIDAFAGGNWSSANAQLRSLLEELIPLVVEEVCGQRPRHVRAGIERLRDDILVEGEFDLLKGLWTMLQHRGSHPGLSDEEEARFRLILVSSEARFLLSRL